MVKNIKEKNNIFIVYKEVDGEEHIFASCNTFVEALKTRKQLEQEKWPIPTNNNTDVSNVNDNISVNDNLDDDFNCEYLDLAFTVTKSSCAMISISRKQAEAFFPISPYEEICDIFVDNIHAKAKLNTVTRFRLTNQSSELINYLKKLYEIKPKKEAKVRLILNKEEQSTSNITVDSQDVSSKIRKLELENKQYANKIKEYENQIDKLNQKINDIKKIIL